MLRTPSSKVAQRGSDFLAEAGDLLEERAGLVAEGVVLAESDAGRVHGQAAGDVGVSGAEDDLAVAVLVGRAVVEEQFDLGRAALVEPAAPFSQKTSKMRLLAWPAATRETSKPAPFSNSAENTA